MSAFFPTRTSKACRENPPTEKKKIPLKTGECPKNESQKNKSKQLLKATGFSQSPGNWVQPLLSLEPRWGRGSRHLLRRLWGLPSPLLGGLRMARCNLLPSWEAFKHLCVFACAWLQGCPTQKPGMLRIMIFALILKHC